MYVIPQLDATRKLNSTSRSKVMQLKVKSRRVNSLAVGEKNLLTKPESGKERIAKEEEEEEKRNSDEGFGCKLTHRKTHNIHAPCTLWAHEN